MKPISKSVMPLKVTNSFYYVKNSVKPSPYVMWGYDNNEFERKIEMDESKEKHMNFLEKLKSNFKE